MEKTIEILKRTYWSRSDAFLLPLTGLPKTLPLPIKSYLFWDKYSIHDYNLILTIKEEDSYERTEFCKRHIFPVLDKNGYLIESYDEEDTTILILDISEWALDIEMFLKGKFSKFSTSAKSLIEAHHKYNVYKIPVYIYGVLYPTIELDLLGGLSPIQYISKYYGFDLKQLEEIGEIGSIYDNMAETLAAYH